MTPTLDLLTEPLITAQTAAGEQRLTLPGLLAALSAGDDVQGFPLLQPHQKHAWHAFLVQLAGLVHARVGDPGTDEATWRTHLLTLAGAPTAFCLVVPDLSQPGFLQPPVNPADLKAETHNPDALDILVTTKVHDVKATRLVTPTAEHWLFALLNLQTMQGFSGRANYGIVRMNGGFSNRPGVGFAPGAGFAARFQRDLRVLLTQRVPLSAQYDPHGPALLWTLPWTDDTALSLPSLDPFFIEICRRVRLIQVGDTLRARTGPSNAARLLAGETKGKVGDIWTPIEVEGDKAITIDNRGIDWRRLHELLFAGRFTPGAAQLDHEGDPHRLWFTAWALVRGQGKTEGLFERWLELPGKLRPFRSPDAWQRMISLSKERVVDVDKMKRDVLRRALLRLISDKPNAKASDHQGYLDRFEGRLEAWADQSFFSQLWADADQPEGTAHHAFWLALWGEAQRIFNEALKETPMPSPRRYARSSRGEGLLFFLRNKHFPELKDLLKPPTDAPATPAEGVSA